MIIEAAQQAHPAGSPPAILQMLDQLAEFEPCDDTFPNVDEGLLAPDHMVL